MECLSVISACLSGIVDMLSSVVIAGFNLFDIIASGLVISLVLSYTKTRKI